MGVFVEYPIIVHIDNFGYIFLLENTLVSQRMMHIDVNHHFIWYYVEDGTLKIKIFRSEENLTDTLNKNPSNGPFQLITSRYIHCY